MSFAANSRYAATETATYTLPDGREVVYLRRRFVPQPENFALLTSTSSSKGERLEC